MKKILIALAVCVVLFSVVSISAFAVEDVEIIGAADEKTQILVADDEYIGDDSVYTDGYIYDDMYESSYYYYDDEFMAEIQSNPVLAELAEDEEIMQILYEVGTENIIAFGICIIIAVIASLLFLPLLIVVIVLAVLNSKAKKQIKELEMKVSPAYSFAYTQNNVANLNYQPQPVEPVAQPAAEAQAPVINEASQEAENTEGGDE